MEELAAWRQWWLDLPRDDPPLRRAASQGFVLATRELAECSVSRSFVRTAVRNGRWFAPCHGVVSPICVDRDGAPAWLVARRMHTLRATAGWLRHPDHVISASSAAIVRGLPTMRIPDAAELTAPNAGGLGRRARGHSFGAFMSARDTSAWYGALITTPARTVIDQARHSRRDGVMIADAALRAGLTTLGELETVVHGARGWPGVCQAREIIAFADPRAESPLESITRLALRDDEFPPPDLQVSIGGYRVDFCWPRLRLILEADGRVKYTDDALWAEKRREAVLRQHGFYVERVIWSDVTRDWATTSARLRRHFTPTPPSSPSVWSI